jgi:hypothetical protein
VKSRRVLLATLAAAMLLGACNLRLQAAPPTLPADAAAAATVNAELLTRQAQPPTAPPAPPTATLPPPASATPEPTATVGCTDRAQFVADISVADGAMFAPGAAFVKTWRLMNVGTCTWTSSYNLVFFSGDQMSGPGGIPIPIAVAPGATVDLSVSLIAPASNGTYQGNWKLRNTNGLLFGIPGEFWVKIIVGQTPTPTPTFHFLIIPTLIFHPTFFLIPAP